MLAKVSCMGIRFSSRYLPDIPWASISRYVRSSIALLSGTKDSFARGCQADSDERFPSAFGKREDVDRFQRIQWVIGLHMEIKRKWHVTTTQQD